MYPYIKRCQWTGHSVKMIGLRNWYQRGALWQGQLAKFYPPTTSKSWGFRLREMQHDWPGGFRYCFIRKAFESIRILHRSYIGHTQHVEIDTLNASPCLSCPVTHEHNEQSSGVLCLFRLSNPIGVTGKLHKQEDIQLFDKFRVVVKRPNGFFNADILSRRLICVSDPKCRSFNNCFFPMWDITI